MKKKVTITLSADILKSAKIRGVEEDKNLSALIEKLLVEWTRDYDEGYLFPCDLEELNLKEK